MNTITLLKNDTEKRHIFWRNDLFVEATQFIYTPFLPQYLSHDANFPHLFETAYLYSGFPIF